MRGIAPPTSAAPLQRSTDELHPGTCCILSLILVGYQDMKLISLNTWGGKIYQPLMEFIKKNSKDTDVFCLQEVFNTTSNIKRGAGYRLNIYAEISKLLTNHQGYFASSLDNYIIVSRSQVNPTKFNLSYGLAIFIKNKVKVEAEGEFFVYRDRSSFDPNNLNTLPRNVQYINFIQSGKKFTVCNLHGIWLKEGKKDAPSRIEQSEKIKQFLDQQMGEKILCGDFNLDINTKSIKILETNLRNLIKDYHIKTTRNKLFPGKEKIADYIFVSDGVKVQNFQVPKVEVSDHLPMILEFSI